MKNSGGIRRMTINQKLREMVSKLGIMNLAKEYGRKKQISKLTGKFLNYKQGQLIELPEEIVFEITGRCNLRCKMCYINFNQNKKDDVSKEDFIKIINKMPFLKKITLIGGEAFIRKDIIKFREGILNRMLYLIYAYFSIQTYHF